MEADAVVKPEAVWLQPDDIIVSKLKKEPEAEIVPGCDPLIFTPGCIEQVSQNHENAKNEAVLSADVCDESKTMLKSDFDIEETCLLQDRSECNCSAEVMDREVTVKPEPMWLVENEEMMTGRIRRKTWDPQNMKDAVSAVRSGEMGYLKAAKTFGVPRGTIEKYVKNRSKTPEELLKMRTGRKPVLPPELEILLVKYCLQMDERYFGLRVSDVKRMAFELAIRNGLRHPFNSNKARAGKNWLKLFLKRHPNLSLRTPQDIFAATIKSFNPENVAAFFNIYEKELEKINYDGHRVYNVDETRLTVVQNKLEKVVACKGKKQIGNLTSAQRGALITTVTCMNATGNYVPPLFMFPQKNMKVELMDGAPPGSISACHISGCIQSDIFSRWFDHFIKVTRPTEEEPVLLVLDGHYSHTRNIEIIEKGRANHVVIVCLPPHSTAKMQPLYVGFMKPLMTYYAQEISKWLRNNPGRVVTHIQVASLYGLAYQKAATMENSMNSFRKTGLIPCNRNIFCDADFAIHAGGRTDEIVIPDSENYIGSTEISHLHEIQKSPEPLPSTSEEQQAKSSRVGKAALITSSPFRQLKESLEKSKKRKTSACKKLFKQQPKKSKTPKCKPKKQHVNNSSDDGSDVEMQLMDSSDSDFDGNDDDAECLFCAGLFSEDTRGDRWAQCSKCHSWAHEKCRADEDPFICPFC